MRKNKDISGFQILNLLAEIDGDFNPKEGQVIIDFVVKKIPLGGNLEDAMEEVSTTDKEDYPILLQKCAEDFYADSNEKDRLELLDFALKLQKADNKIDQNENWLINKLYQYWDLA